MPADDSRAFYDSLADDYDRMIEVERRLAAARTWIAALRRERTVERAVDVATGTGVYALALAAEGVQTVGADLSPAMLQQARARAERLGLDVEWVASPMQELAAHIATPADLVLCLGNSLPHLLTEHDLHHAIAAMADCLRPGGRLMLQFINYPRVLAAGRRVVAVTRAADTEFVRFYDFLPMDVRFNVLAIRWDDGKAEHRLESTTLHPWTADAVAAVLARHGFHNVRRHADFQSAPFDPDASDAVVILAERH